MQGILVVQRSSRSTGSTTTGTSLPVSPHRLFSICLNKMAFIQTLLAIVVPVVVNAACHHASPAFPPVHRILREEQFKQLRSALDSVIPDILSNPDGWTTNTTSFAVQVTSANQTLWDSYYTAPILGEYKDSEPTPVTGDTAFRIASISKSFTVYAILLENKIKLDDPITKYIPELVEQCPEGGFYPAWDQIIIRSLASQLSGIAREGTLILYLLE
jgi:CubicO group peptidase (beta-lactamase class C family)